MPVTAQTEAKALAANISLALAVLSVVVWIAGTSYLLLTGWSATLYAAVSTPALVVLVVAYVATSPWRDETDAASGQGGADDG